MLENEESDFFLKFDSRKRKNTLQNLTKAKKGQIKWQI
jgi:hypothetical protein